MSRALVTCLGRLTVLFVFTAGFLTMHGVFAVSASADGLVAHAPATAEDEQRPVAPTPLQEASALAAPSGAPAPSDPAEHHGLVVSCVIALVGIAVLSVAGLALHRRYLRSARSLRRILVDLRHWLEGEKPGSPPVRIALCVIRV